MRAPTDRRRMPRCIAFSWTLAILSVVVWVGAISAQPVDGPVPEQVQPLPLTYDFRGGKPLPPGFQLAGALHELTALPEEDGFRLSLSGTKPNGIGRAGLEMKTLLRGDFAITAGYEILQAEPPKKGQGVGFELYAHTVHTPQQGFGVYRMEKVQQGEMYLVSRSYRKDDGTPAWRNKSIPTTTKSGRLRITRTGTEATAWAADGKDPQFKELSHDDIGRDDITVIWLMAYTGHVSRRLELRLTDLEIRSGITVPAPPPVESVPPPVSPPRLWKTLTVIGLLVVFTLLIGITLLWRLFRRRVNG